MRDHFERQDKGMYIFKRGRHVRLHRSRSRFSGAFRLCLQTRCEGTGLSGMDSCGDRIAESDNSKPVRLRRGTLRCHSIDTSLVSHCWMNTQNTRTTVQLFEDGSQVSVRQLDAFHVLRCGCSSVVRPFVSQTVFWSERRESSSKRHMVAIHLD